MTTETEPIHRPGTVDVVDVGVELVTVKVWQLPIRYIHWSFVLCVAVLSLTGFYIGRPFTFAGTEPAYFMAKVRFIHALFAWLFIVTLAARIVFMFTGNRWARWDQFVPANPARRHWIRRTLKYYLFLRKEPPPAIGHNPLAGITYLVVFAMFLLQILTGLALQGFGAQSGWKWAVGGWLAGVLGGIQYVRLTHHLVMWLTIGFAIHHVFSVILIDHEERSGITSSMVSGVKRLPLERL